MMLRFGPLLVGFLFGLGCTTASGEAGDAGQPTEPHACEAINAESVGKEDPPEPHSSHHLLKVAPNDLVEVSVEVKVRKVPTEALRFFALQVNFNGDAWAHGGLQRDPTDGRANWGCLVRGIDYDLEGAELETLNQIQNVEGRTGPAPWQLDTWYRLHVVRGDAETLPAGMYSVLDEDPIEVPHDRTMRRWDFTIEEVESGAVIWQHHLFTQATRISSFLYWTETGYGMTCDDVIEVDWRNPLYHSLAWGGPRLPDHMQKSLSQSSCSLSATTDIVKADLGGDWGTTQLYGTLRPEDSCHGQTLYGEP
jgi:hypothetical protein